MKKKSGFTLIEIVVSSVILSLVLAGLASTFITGITYSRHSQLRMTGGELGRLFLDPFQMAVRQSDWDQGSNLFYIPAADNSRQWPGQAETLNGIDYTPSYTVSRVNDANGNDTGLRRLKAVVRWTEPEA